jgi:hypothetical protein
MFKVTELTFQDFTNFSSLLKNPLFFRKVTEEGEPLHWQEDKWFCYNQIQQEKIIKQAWRETNHSGS